MLLTGYDAPIVQVMYLDKLLKEHNLLQAIARVNRTREYKTAGFIIDYCGITGRLTQALEMYAEDLNPKDIMETSKDEFAACNSGTTNWSPFSTASNPIAGSAGKWPNTCPHTMSWKPVSTG